MNKIEVIAEIGINHGGSMDLAEYLILEAKRCGADVAKFQLSDVDVTFPDKKIMAQEKNWYNEAKKAQLSKEQVLELAECCKEVGIEFFASATDLERLGWLEEVGVKRHKVAYRMNQDKVLIETMLKTGKQVLISHREDYKFPGSIKYWNKYISLYCIPEYPTPLSNCKLQYVDFIHDYSGLSSHYPGIEPALYAIARGAKIIEVHFCLSRKKIIGPDITSSIEPKELKELVRIARVFEKI